MHQRRTGKTPICPRHCYRPRRTPSRHRCWPHFRDAAAQATALRNQIMELARRRSSPTARAYVMRLKREGRSVSELSEKYAKRLYGSAFSSLTEQRQASVFKEIIQASGRPDEGVMRLAQQLGRAGRRLLLVSLAVAAYDVAEADDKPREAIRQGALAGAGLMGGWAAGSAAVGMGVCAATAPACVVAIAFVGGLLATYGAEASFGAVYPRPTR